MYKNQLATTMVSTLILLNFVLCYGKPTEVPPEQLLKTLVAEKWGADKVLLPSPKMLVQYEEDLGERWVINFENGEIKLECLWRPTVSRCDPDVVDAMIGAVSNLYLSIPTLPEFMLREQQSKGFIPALAAKSVETIYVVKKGDTLSEISEHLRVPLKEIMQANSISDADHIKIGRSLLIPPAPPHMHTRKKKHTQMKESLLHGQLRDPQSGEIITSQTIGEFGSKVVRENGMQVEIIQGTDGRTRKLTRVKLSLSKNHLHTRARKFYPLVREQAERFGHDPALIMALIHTESAFNPHAKSEANAYGLMQIVPSSGGREAYKWLHKKDIKPSPAYLLKPSQNLELGNAYMKILNDRIFSGVKNPQSRLYCVVAAYNGGGSNVGVAFTGRKSVQTSLATINSQSPTEVRRRLEKKSPHRETRRYVKQVLDRISIYRAPRWQ